MESASYFCMWCQRTRPASIPFVKMTKNRKKCRDCIDKSEALRLGRENMLRHPAVKAATDGAVDAIRKSIDDQILAGIK